MKTHVRKYIDIYVCRFVHTGVHLSVLCSGQLLCIYICKYMYMYTCIYIYMYVYIYMYILKKYVYIYIYMYVHTVV